MSTDDRYTEDEGYSEGTYDDDDAYDETYDEDDGSWWDKGIVGLLLIAGVVLFFFPEPATSAIGILLIGLAVVAWIADLILPT